MIPRGGRFAPSWGFKGRAVFGTLPVMKRIASWAWLLGLCACSGESATPSQQPPPAVTAPAPAKPAAPAAAPNAPDPCSTPGPQTVEVTAGEILQGPWGIELTYTIDEDNKRGPGFLFLLRNGTRRWQTRRDESNWSQPQTWRGFCWRGAEHPERRASHVKIDIAPVCKDGQLQELGGCGTALGS